MANTLKREALADIRDGFLDFNVATRTRRDALEDDGIITRDESNHIGKFEEQLALIASDLNDVILRQVIADIEEPAQRIRRVTDDLKDAVVSLNRLNDFIGVFSALLSLATVILTAFTTGNPLALVGALTQLENLI